MVYNFLCKDEKTRRNIYLLLLKTSVWKEVRHFFRTVYPNRNHVTTHCVTKQVAQWAMIAHHGASIMFGDTIIYDAQKADNSELETVTRN